MREKIDYKSCLEAYNKAKESSKVVSLQANKFKELTGYSRRTFFSFKYFLRKGETYKTSYRRVIKTIQDCYFCPKKSQVIHHINLDRNDSTIDNLLPLCNSCHTKIHLVCAKMKQGVNK